MIIAEGIRKSFEGREILRGVDISVNNGEFLSIMGKSGSGKSTLLNVLAGNLRSDSGKVLFDGEDISLMDEKRLSCLRRTKLGFVYQSLNLIPTLDARDNILLPIFLDKKSLKCEETLTELGEYLEISHLFAKFPSEMSGGERQRVAIARSLIHTPSVIMLDEPTGSLDSRSGEKVMELLKKINTDRGVTVIQVTHSPDGAAYGDRTVILSDGEVIG